MSNYSRVVVAGLSGDAGKTVVSCGLVSSLRDKGLNVSAFKKGPDYIDAAWLSLASGKPARNLDTYLMGFRLAKKSFLKNAAMDGISVIEGNRGLFDGVDARGTHSTAELAKLLQAPVVIVQDISKVTRSAAAIILGCMKLDPDLNIAGVVLNRVANIRHAGLAREAIEEITGVPVLGMIPKLSRESVLPSRHLGLVTPNEFERRSAFLLEIKEIIEGNVDVDGIIEVAKRTATLEFDAVRDVEPGIMEHRRESSKVKIAFFRDESFSFYYPENLEMLDDAGAELIPVSPSHDTLGDDIDALYIGGGFPEMNLQGLASNRRMMFAVKEAAEDGLPVYAECGGLMYLARSIEWNGNEHPMSGVLPIKVSMYERPQGHGYCEAVVDNENPFFKVGTTLRGHEFHYSKIAERDREIETSFALSRGVGCFNKRDGLKYKNVFASYIHLHAVSTPEWVSGMISCARKYKSSKMTTSLTLA